MSKSPEANPKKLLELIENVYRGEVVLPDFQRSFVWDRGNIEEFLGSLLRGYFIGTFLVLDSPSSKPVFPFTFVEGAKDCNSLLDKRKIKGNVEMILDGQQRITSLFYALYSPSKVKLKNTKSSYEFYLDLQCIVDDKIEEAVVGISSNVSKRKREYEEKHEAGLAVPVSLMRNDGFLDWLYEGQKIWEGDERKKIKNVYDNLSQFMVPVVTLPEKTPKDDIVNIFERINRTGVGLSLFDLAVAQLYSKGVKLRELWEKFEKENSNISKIVDGLSILRVIVLANDNEIRKRELLDALDQEEDFSKTWSDCVTYIKRAYSRIQNEYCAFHEKWIPSKQLVVTLAAILYRSIANCPNDSKHDLSESEYRKIDTWYWCAAFSQRYDSHYVTTAYTDVRRISEWVVGSETKPPDWIEGFQASELQLERISKGGGTTTSMYKACMTFIITHGVRDFYNGQASVSYSTCDDDHIFCKHLYSQNTSIDSILNRTLITSSTNKQKSKKSTNIFFAECMEKHGGEREKLLATLETHLISSDAFQALMDEDYETFLSKRRSMFEEKIMSVTSFKGQSF